MNNKTILVTGGAGFIGSNFIHYLFGKYPGIRIINLDLLTYAGNLENLKDVADKPNYTFVRGDIADSKLVNEIAPAADSGSNRVFYRGNASGPQQPVFGQ